MTAFVEHHQRVDGVEVSFLDGGQGSPLLFLHGSGGRPGPIPFLGALARRSRVLVPEHPGYGATERIPWVRTMTDLALYYRHLVRDLLGLESVTLVGHNLGGWLAAECAIWFPGLVERLVLLDAHGLRPATAPALDLFNLSPDRLRAAGWADPAKAPPPTPATDLTGIRNKAMTAQLAWGRLHDPRLAGRLRWITAPTLVIWGAADGIVPVEHATAYTSAITGARHELVGDAGHYPHIEQPDAVAAVIEAFIQRTSGVAA